MRMFSVFIFSTISLAGLGQGFQAKVSVALPAGTKPSQVFWIDLDNDSLLDIVIADTSQHKLSVFAYTHLLTTPLKKDLINNSGFSNGIITAADLNSDAKIDLIISGTSPGGAQSTVQFLNASTFIFSKSIIPILPFAASKIFFYDMDANGAKDAVVLRKNTGWTTLKNLPQGFKIIADSAMTTVADLVVSDFDGNGFNDIAISGKNKASQPVLYVIEYKSQNEVLRAIALNTGLTGTLETGDLNHDGFFDLIVAGENITATAKAQVFINHQTFFSPGQILPGLTDPVIRIADVDSDGKADIAFFGKINTGKVAWIKTFAGDSIILNAANRTHQILGDYDRDSDLDILQLTADSLIILENKTFAKNSPPSTPKNPIAYKILSRLLLFWDKSQDDRTPPASLTYDVTIFSQSTPVATGEFDLDNFMRLTVSHGNQGTRNFALMNHVNGATAYSVESIDNAFLPSTKPGICSGDSFNGGDCSVLMKTISVCNDLPFSIAAGEQAYWFSFSLGSLGLNQAVVVDPLKSDTIFSFVPRNGSCPRVTVYILSHSAQDTVRLSSKITACPENQVELKVDSEWENLVWQCEGLLVGAGNPLQVAATTDKVYTGTGNNKRGCFVKATKTLTISKPVVTLASEAYKVIKGGSVQLVASGGETYLWTPAQGLDNNQSPSPTATPSETTNYLVTIADSIGCKAHGNVIVYITSSAFIPTLFTPNADGKNEDLKVYGLYSAHGFRLSIYNREGAIVYETTDVYTASSQGWNGTCNGSQQPPGLYYWKVEGSTDSGDAVRLNDKKNGSVLLVR